MLLRSRYVLFVSPAASLILLLAGTPPQSARAQSAALPANVAANRPSQASPRVHLAPTDAQTLADALRSLVKQMPGISFVAEGKPYRARGSAPPLAPLALKWPAAGLPLQEAVTKVAAVYDYQAERSGDVFLLRKRYTVADDLPDVTMDELKLALRDASRAASPLPAPTVELPTYEEKNTPFADKFYRTLTPEQIKRLVTVNRNYVQLPVSELTSAQKQMMQSVVVSRHIQKAVDEPQKAYAALRACEQKTTAFGWADLVATRPDTKKTQTARILCCMVRENGKTALVPFAPDGRMRFRFDNRRIGYREADDNQDASAPEPGDFGPNRKPLPPPNESGQDTYTLQTLAQLLRQKAVTAQIGIKPPTYGVQEALREKSITVIGADETNGNAVWRAAGAVYGLRVVREQNDAWRMERPRAQVGRDLAGLNAAVFAAFPAPLIRLYRGVFGALEAKNLAEAKEGFYQPQDGDNDGLKAAKVRMWTERAQRNALQSASLDLYMAVLHRFRVLLEPGLDKATDSRVLYSDLNAEAHNLWTLFLMLDCLKNASELEGESLPLTVTAFDKGYVTASIIDGFGTSEAQLYITFWARDGETYKNVDAGHVFPLPDSVPKSAKPVK